MVRSEHGTIIRTSSRPEVFFKKDVLRNFTKFTGKHLCQTLFFNNVAGLACNFIKKETLAQVFSREICEISKNTFSYRTTRVAASVRLCFCKVSGLEYRILLKQDLFKNVFLGIFQKFSEELFRKISTRSSHPEYSTKKVFSPAALLTKRLRYK